MGLEAGGRGGAEEKEEEEEKIPHMCSRPLPKSRATGIADHILPLGYCF